MDLISGCVDQTSSAAAKIALFRSLFRGRDDVYPRRFESRKTGKFGYAPACANEWVRGICEKPRIKVRHIGHAHLESVARDAERRGRILGVSLPPAEDDEPAPWAAPPSR